MSKSDKSSFPVFRIKPLHATKAIVKYVGSIAENDKLGDEVVELDKPIHPMFAVMGRHAIPFAKIGQFEIVGKIYRCNIVGSHLVVSNRYPVMYLDISYEKPMVSGSLFQIFYSIDMNRDEKREITNNSQYVNLQFSGEWVKHIDCDDELTENYERMILDLLESEAINNVASGSIENKSEEDILQLIKEYVDTEKTIYDSFIKNQPVQFSSTKNLRNTILELCGSEKFHKFIQIAMKCREIHRRKEYGLEEESTCTIPENIVRMEDIKQKIIDDDEVILDD